MRSAGKNSGTNSFQYPVTFELRGKEVVVIGGGRTAERKVEGLIDAGASVSVVAPHVTGRIRALAADGAVGHEPRPYALGDIDGATLVFVAVSDPELSAEVAGHARTLGIPVNVADRPELCDFAVPAVIKRGRLSVAVSTGGASPAWASRIRQELEVRIEPEYEDLFEALVLIRKRLIQTIADPGYRRKILLSLADPANLKLARAFRGEDLAAAILNRAKRHLAGAESWETAEPCGDRGNVTGKVSLVGAGPGDPDLITVRGLRLLDEADSVFYDRLIPLQLLARVRDDTELFYVGKGRGWQCLPQERIAEEMAHRALSGRRVVRLKGGDPLLFARGGEELSALADLGIPVEVVPGITAAFGAAASSKLPLTHRDICSSVTFVTGHGDPGSEDPEVDWAALARTGGTLVVYMGLKYLESVSAALIRGGLSPNTPCAVLRMATTPEEESVTAPLIGIARAVRARGFRPPALFIAGDVVKHADFKIEDVLSSQELFVPRDLAANRTGSKETISVTATSGTGLSARLIR
jgi:uroporphyrin-III C-methyltransferase/precorrin-2 dehydrogenase/sirohydrochlorin ferrochelatase